MSIMHYDLRWGRRYNVKFLRILFEYDDVRATQMVTQLIFHWHVGRATPSRSPLLGQAVPEPLQKRFLRQVTSDEHHSAGGYLVNVPAAPEAESDD